MNFHHGSDRFRDSGDERRLDRPALDTAPTKVMIDGLMAHMRDTFYSSQAPIKWLQEQRQILMVITWPATWLNQRGVGLSCARYEAIMRGIIAEIQEHGATNEIKYVPAYFERTVKSWFAHNGEGLYEELKSIRNALDLRFLGGLKANAPAGPDPMVVLAQTNAVLATARRRAKAQKSDDNQPDLFSV